MKQHSRLWQWAGFAVVTLLGTILHFLFDWTGGSLMVAPFSGVNESTWEHMKLLYWPLFLFGLVQWFFFRDRGNFWLIKLAQTLLGLLLIPVLFYTCNGIFGHSPDWVNISIFYLAAAGAFLLERRFFRRDRPSICYPELPLGAMLLIAIAFVAFTFFPPRIPLFQDPVTGFYGISG